MEPEAEAVVEVLTFSRKNPSVQMSHANNDIASLYKEHVVGINGSAPLMQLKASVIKLHV